MVAEGTSAGLRVGWCDSALRALVDVGADGVARLSLVAPAPRGSGARPDGAATDHELARATGLPLVDVVVAGSGRGWSGRRYADSVVGRRMCYVGHEERDEGPWHELQVTLEDAATGLAAIVHYQFLRDGGVVRSRTTLSNGGSVPVTVESVTSFLGGGLAGPGGDLDDVDLLWAENDWLSEARWQTRRFRDALPDLNREAHEARSRARFALTSAGSWSSGTFLPMGAAVNRRSGHALVWQIEHNGAWQWQVGEHTGADAGASYLALLGPTDTEHQWRLVLRPGERFESVPAALAVSNQGFEGAIGRMTRYRRALRRPHQDNRRMPVIFNDYMNTLMGDPTTDRLKPLISAAADAGAECFCIDSGWYAELGENWWDTVGAWVPSRSRFPKGIGEVIELITARGMVPGLWIEPEVVGVRSAVASHLPLGAFFTRAGERVVEQGRYHLDLRHPGAREHLDKVVDFLVGELGVGYLKMDYNIDVAPGTDSGDPAAGVGLLGHNRAFLDWVDALLDRHAGLTLESCASGGMRTDYATLSRFQLHSTSDQQDPLRYPPIAAAAPVAVPPEQAAVWAYPQPEWDDDRIAFTLCSAMLGRVHLSGHLDRMAPAQRRLVAEAVATYKKIRSDLAGALPFWPLGLPRWSDAWVALGMRAVGTTYVVVWARGRQGGNPSSNGDGADVVPGEVSLPIGALGPDAVAEVLYPRAGAQARWHPGPGELAVTLPRSPSACLVALASG